jgi:hypothetical protein
VLNDSQIIAPLLEQNNSGACCATNSTAYSDQMDNRKPKITDEHRQEAALLKALFKKNAGMSQDAFASDYGLGGQANVGHYLNARQPLNLTAALKFATGLGCKIEEFSPRLAQALGEDLARPRDNPFSKVKRVVSGVHFAGPSDFAEDFALLLEDDQQRIVAEVKRLADVARAYRARFGGSHATDARVAEHYQAVPTGEKAKQ